MAHTCKEKKNLLVAAGYRYGEYHARRRIEHVTICCVAIAMFAMAFLGCGSSSNAPKEAELLKAQSREVPSISGSELQKLVQQHDGLLLVEFGVNVGCFRCDDMRPQVELLAREFDGQTKVVRVDFNAHRQLAAQYGADICPSYVLFKDGSPVVTRCYPTSSDLLAADVDSMAIRHDDQSATTGERSERHVDGAPE
jgi:thioredoxin 1